MESHLPWPHASSSTCVSRSSSASVAEVPAQPGQAATLAVATAGETWQRGKGYPPVSSNMAGEYMTNDDYITIV